MTTVIAVEAVTEFVHNNVLDAVDRCLNEVGVESDAPLAVATSPARTHSAQFYVGCGHTVARCDLCALLQVALKCLFRLPSIPSIYDLLHTCNVCFVGNGNIKKFAS